MEEIREPNYGNLKEALGAGNAANITSALLSSELFDDFMDMVGNDREIAKTFVKLMSSLMDKSCYRHEQEDPEFQKRLSATFTVQLGRRSTGDRSVTQLTVLETMDDLLRYELFLLVTQGKGYKYCKNCGKPFIPSGRSDTVYCDRVMDGADKPCSEIGAYLADVKKVASDPVLSAYRKAYQRLHKRVELGYMEDEEFTRWKDEAVQKRDSCMAGELDAEEFLAWVDATSRRR